VEDPDVRAKADVEALAARVRALVPDSVAVELRQDTRWWVQVNWTGPSDDVAAAGVVERLEGAGLVLLPRVGGPAGDIVDRVALGELLEVAER
jgi:hypothetical protein